MVLAEGDVRIRKAVFFGRSESRRSSRAVVLVVRVAFLVEEVAVDDMLTIANV